MILFQPLAEPLAGMYKAGLVHEAPLYWSM